MVNDALINTTELIEKLSPAISDKLSPLITIFKAVGIVLLIYIVFLIIKALFRWRAASRIGKIAKNVEQINEKMDILIKKSEKREAKKPKKEKSKKKNI